MISTLKIKKHFKILIFLLIVSHFQTVAAQTNNKNIVNIYFFHSKDCSHCHEESRFLNSIEEKYDNINIYRYEIHENQNNELRINIQEIYDIKTNGVPLTIIGDTPYTGYLDSKSPLIFTKTIEYYSRYGYKDQVGQLLQIGTASNNKIDESVPTLEDFLKNYGNYKLIGSIYTDNLDTSSNSLILGILSQFNIIKIIFIIIVVILVSKIKEPTKELYLITNYFIISFILNTTYVVSNYIYSLMILIIIVTLFIIGLFKTKEKQYLYSSILIIIAIISSYLENNLYITYSKIFKEILKLHNLTGLNKISYFGNYFFIIIIIDILFILIIYGLKNKINSKKDFLIIK